MSLCSLPALCLHGISIILEVRGFLEVTPRDPGVGGQEVQAAQAAWPLARALLLLQLLTLEVINMGRTVRGK